MSDPTLCEYGIVANALETEPTFRIGAKVWLCHGDNGDGFENRVFYGLGKGGGRKIEKWARTIRFHNFRCAWVPENLRFRVLSHRGTRAEVEVWAKEIDELVEGRRLSKAGSLPAQECKENNP